MERTVDQRDLHRVHRITGQRTVGHSRLEALLNRRNELLGNVAALHLIDERKAHLAVLGGTDLEDDVGELTAAAGLLLEDLAVLNRLGERLLVVHLRGTLVDLHAELAAQTVYDDVEVELTHTADNRLTRILVGVNREGRVLLSQLAQGDTELVEVLLGLGLYGQTDHRLGEGHLLQHDRCVLGAERVARADLLETYGCADVAGADGLHRVLLVGVHLVDTADTLAFAAARIEDVGTCIEFARVDAHESQTAYERIGGDLEGQPAERVALGRLARSLLAGARVGSDHCVDIQRRGQERHHVVEQQLDALVLERRTAEHRNDLHADSGLADRGEQLVGSDRIGILEEFLHQCVVRRSDLFDQLRTPLGSLGFHVLGNLLVGIIDQFGFFRIVVNDSPIIYKVYQAGKFVFRADGQYDGHRGGAEALLDLSADSQEVGSGTVHLVDVTQAGYAVLVGLTPYGLGLGLNAAHGAERRNGAVQHTKRTLHLGGEVHVARGVDHVDLVGLVLVVPEGGGSSRSDGDTALLLLNHPVHRRSAFVNLADLVGLTGVEKDTLGGSGFTGIDVSHDTDIPRKS